MVNEQRIIFQGKHASELTSELTSERGELTSERGELTSERGELTSEQASGQFRMILK